MRLESDSFHGGRKVTTIDDALFVFEDRDLNSAARSQLREGVEILIGNASEFDGREWFEASLPGGIFGYVLGPSVRSHTRIMGDVAVHGATPDPQLSPMASDRDHSIKIAFAGSIRDAALTLIACVGWSLTVVGAAWGYARVYKWLFQSLQFHNGTKADFKGDPKKIWFPAMSVGLFPSLNRWLTSAILTQVGDETTRMALVSALLILLWFAQTVLWLKVWRWAVPGISVSSGTVLYFDGGVIACFAFVSLSSLLASLLVPTRGLILLVYPPLFFVSIRWCVKHIRSDRHRIQFVGSLMQVWWRAIVAPIFMIPLITVPAIVVWLNKWGAANILIERVVPKTASNNRV